MRRTKIVCTLGPASNSEEMIERLLKAGMNVMRLNFSHGSYEDHAATIEKFRRVRDRLGMPAAVLLDTKGPEIRLGAFKEDMVRINDGDDFVITTDQSALGSASEAPISWEGLPKALKGGERILIDDGKVALRVVRTDDTRIFCEVVNGGIIKSRKSVNVPGVSLPMVYLSEVDKKDILFGIEHKVDFIAASFVRRAGDVKALRTFLNENGGKSIKIISKIESIEGVDNFDDILAVSDGIMVARGDLGVEVDYRQLPGLQKRFIHSCYSAGKMVITATQMLESMITSPVPTRAEITDVANAVFDGTSAVMLSGESAVGKYPEEAVKALADITEQAEKDALEMGQFKKWKFAIDASDTTNAICDAACMAASDLSAAAIVAVTQSGGSARNVSKFRPVTPIIAATPEKQTYHQLALSWGVFPLLTVYQNTSDALLCHAVNRAVESGYIMSGDRVVIVAGLPLATVGSTNLVKVQIAD